MSLVQGSVLRGVRGYWVRGWYKGIRGVTGVGVGEDPVQGMTGGERSNTCRFKCPMGNQANSVQGAAVGGLWGAGEGEREERPRVRGS